MVVLRAYHCLPFSSAHAVTEGIEEGAEKVEDAELSGPYQTKMLLVSRISVASLDVELS